MRVHAKYLNRDIDLIGAVDRYQQAVYFLISRVKPRHRIDESEARRILASVTELLYLHYRDGLRQQRPNNDAPLDNKVRHNLSVKHLRQEFHRAKRLVQETFRAW